MFSYLSLLLATSTSVFGLSLRASSVHLAVSPKCGSLGGAPVDVNAGINDLSSFDTIVAFGDSFTAGGAADGTALPPAVVVPPSALAGGRVSNGPLWIEHIARAANATLKDFSVKDALVDASQYYYTTVPPARDFLSQVNYFIGDYHNRPNPNTTLYVIFFGSGDYTQSQGYKLPPEPSTVAGAIAYGLLELASSPIFAKNFLIVDVYGRGTSSTGGETYKSQLFTGLGTLNKKYKLNVAFADLAPIWDGVLNGNPGAAAFGYTSTGACVTGETTDSICSSPDTTFSWIPGYPSAATHGIVADYVQEVLEQCA